MWHPLATFDAVDLSSPKEYPQKIQLPFDVEFCRMGEEPRFHMRIADANGHHKDVSLVPDDDIEPAERQVFPVLGPCIFYSPDL